MIIILFNILFLLIPLVFYKNTSEIFEFNKIILLYISTILITASWAVKSIMERKIIFRRTTLDLPLVSFLVILLLSCLVSIDPRTSFFGYYSRFNGGILSIICYLLLYWAFVSNLTQAQRLRVMSYGLIGTAIASLLAIGEHFGIFTTCYLMGFLQNQSCWVQDVQNRVFSTLGQPNWLAATVTALMPLTWLQMLNTKKRNAKFIFWIVISILFFTTLLFTKSRSGLLAFGIELVIFWIVLFWKEKFKFWKPFLILNSFFLILFIFFNPLKVPDLGLESPTIQAETYSPINITSSGDIRKIVWKGAFNIWQNYPILGTGPETFAYAYPMFKPKEHNLTSEWDFIYNKAHNEYLNFLATTGAFGLISYLLIILTSLSQIKNSIKIENYKLKIAIAVGYCGILITNFFGFSVTPVSLLFFLLPALTVPDELKPNNQKPTTVRSLYQWLSISIILLTTYYLLLTTVRYFIADINYNKGKNENLSKNYDSAIKHLTKATNLNPNEAIYWSELAITDIENSYTFSKKAIALSPYNLNIKKNHVIILNRSLQENPKYLNEAIETLISAIAISPNDPKLYYQLGLMYLKIGDVEKGLNTLNKTIELKPNYKEGRFALGVTYKDLKMFNQAREQFEYILKNIDSDDQLTQKYLKELK